MAAIRVISAVPLLSAERERLEAAWAKKFGQNKSFIYETDVSLIGGIRIDDGACVYDASIKGQLARLRKTL